MCLVDLELPVESALFAVAGDVLDGRFVAMSSDFFDPSTIEDWRVIERQLQRN